MAQEQIGSGGTPAEPNDQPQAGTPPPTPSAVPVASQADTAESISLEEAKKLRSEANSLRRRLNELEAKQKQEDDAKLSEHERLQKKVASLEAERQQHQTERRELLTRSAIERQARVLNIVDEDAAYRLLDLGTLEFNDAGEPTNVEKALKKLIEAKPYLVAADQSTPGSRTPTQGTRALPQTPRPAAPATPVDLIAQQEQAFRESGQYRPF